MFMQRVEDYTCNRCGGLYSNMERRTMSITVEYVSLAICAKCTEEVAALMGFSAEEITKKLALIKRAETENNHQYAIEHGDLCKVCEKGFKEGEPRIRKNTASNVKSWHLTCYPK